MQLWTSVTSCWGMVELHVHTHLTHERAHMWVLEESRHAVLDYYFSHVLAGCPFLLFSPARPGQPAPLTVSATEIGRMLSWRSLLLAKYCRHFTSILDTPHSVLKSKVFVKIDLGPILMVVTWGQILTKAFFYHTFIVAEGFFLLLHFSHHVISYWVDWAGICHSLLFGISVFVSRFLSMVLPNQVHYISETKPLTVFACMH